MTQRRSEAAGRSRSGLRSWAALALLGAPGPGALVALAGFVSGDHAHAISLERDVTHADLVLCHDDAEPADAARPAFATRDCANDHRVHLASAEGPVLRGDAKLALASCVTAALASTTALDSRPVARTATPDFGPALVDASRIHRTIVLRL